MKYSRENKNQSRALTKLPTQFRSASRSASSHQTSHARWLPSKVLYQTPSLPLLLEGPCRSQSCILCGIQNPPVSDTEYLLFFKRPRVHTRRSRNLQQIRLVSKAKISKFLELKNPRRNSDRDQGFQGPRVYQTPGPQNSTRGRTRTKRRRHRSRSPSTGPPRARRRPTRHRTPAGRRRRHTP